MRHGKSRLLALFLIVFLVALSACGDDGGETTTTTTTASTTGASTTSGSTTSAASTTTAPPQAGGVLVAGSPTEPTSLDPILESVLTSWLVMAQMYDTLIQFSPELDYEPQLAESWVVADDGMSVTFTLRSGVTFHSGKALTSADVLYSFDRLRSEDSIQGGLYAGIAEITAPDDLTVVFTLVRPEPAALLSILAVNPSVIQDQSVVEASGDLTRVDGGSGPFKLDEWASGTSITLSRFEDHWAGGTPLDGLEFRFVPDELSAVAALRAGEIDWFNFTDPSAAVQIDGDPALVYTESAALPYTYIAFNTTKPPFSSLSFRLGVSYALDRNEILALALEGRGQVTGPVAPGLPASLPLSEYPSYTYNEDEARRLLGEAGVMEMSLELSVSSAQAAAMAAAPVVVDQLSRVGINATIVPLESGVWFDNLSTLNYDLIFGQSGGYPNSDIPFTNSHGCGGAWNYSGICNPDFDTLVNAAKSALGDERNSLYEDAQRMLVNEMMPYAYLFTMDSLWGWSANVQGFVPLPLKEIRFDNVSLLAP